MPLARSATRLPQKARRVRCRNTRRRHGPQTPDSFFRVFPCPLLLSSHGHLQVFPQAALPSRRTEEDTPVELTGNAAPGVRVATSESFMEELPTAWSAQRRQGTLPTEVHIPFKSSRCASSFNLGRFSGELVMVEGRCRIGHRDH